MALEVLGKYDVVVAGGGPAGIIAAIAAGRNGARTLLVERLGYLGGEPVGGLILHGFHNQRGDLIVRGVPYELIERLQQQDAAISRVQMRQDRKHQAAISVDHEALKYTAMEMILEAGAEILFHSVLTDALVEREAVRGVSVFNKSGHQLLLADVVVDASGDGDVAFKAGAPFEKGRPQDGLMQPMTLLFTLGGVDLRRVVQVMEMEYGVATDPETGRETEDVRWFAATLEPWAREAEAENLFPHIPDKRKLQFRGNAFRDGEVNLNATAVTGVDATNALDLTRGEIEGRRQAAELTRFLRKYVPGFEGAYLLRSAPRVGVRESRRFLGDYYLTYEDFLTEARFADVVARSGFFVDIHNPRPDTYQHEPEGGILSKTRGDFDIPYRALLPQGREGLLVAGRCISASPEAFASARVTGPVMAMGQAAGTAAALAVRHGCTPRQLDVAVLQQVLRQQGADLGESVLAPA